MKKRNTKCLIFELDGVITQTAKVHALTCVEAGWTGGFAVWAGINQTGEAIEKFVQLGADTALEIFPTE